VIDKEIRPVREKWKGTMTDRERFNRQMHFQSVDRSFNMEFGYWDELFDKWELFRDHNIRSNEEADVLFSFDPLKYVGGQLFLYPPFEEKVIEQRAKTNIIINKDGLTAEVPRDRHDTIPHFIHSSVQTPEDWKRVKEERFRVDDPRRLPDIEKLKKLYPDDRVVPLGVDCGSMIGRIRDLLTFEGLCYAVYDYPEMLEDMIETTCQITECFLDHVLPHFTFDFASGWEDICFNKGPILSPAYFRDVIAPRYKRIHKKLEKYGIDVWYTDCDGDVRPILPILLDCGINCLFPYEVNSCAHPGQLLDKYPGQLRIMGGFDKMQLIEGKQAIKAYMESLVPYVERGGYIPFCDHRCPADVSQENYLYYLELKEKMFGMR
jgi:uroporphyrinogen decarboxylase